MYFLPKPRQINFDKGSFIISYDKKIVIDSSCGPNAFIYAKLIQDEFKSAVGYGIAITRSDTANAVITGHDAGNTPDNTAIVLKIISGMDDEEYSINVNSRGAVIEASSDSGLLYGIQTFRQIIRQTGYIIPFIQIHDFPGIKNRGFYHDVTRGRIPTLSYLKKLADKLSFYKINQLQLYIEHSFLFEDLSEVWRDDTPLCAEDILELDDYCKKLCIDLIPSLSCFGHLYKILRTKSFGHLCELEDTYNKPFSFNDRMMHHTINITDDESFEFIKKLIDEYMPLFSSMYFNIGADETFDLGKGKNKTTAEKDGTQKLYTNYVGKLCGYVISKGKTPMFWGDIICDSPDLIKTLPKETICLNWGYDADVSDTSTKKLHNAEARLYNCPGVCGWNQFVPEYDTAYENIRRMCDYAYKYKVEGVLITDWGDYGHINHPDFSIPGMIYGAALSWNYNFSVWTPLQDHIDRKFDTGFDEINRAISLIEFSDISETLISIISDISHNWDYKWKDIVDYIEGKADIPSPDKFSKTQEMSDNLDVIAENLKKLLPDLPLETKYFVHAIFIAINGMKLIQKTGMIISSCKYLKAPVIISDSEADISAVPATIAAALENWFTYYRELWDTVSRPSELYRISNIIFKIADVLREI